MTSVCPAGHDSDADDYCDVCGAPIDATAVIPAATSAPTGLAGPTPTAAAGATGGAQACPNCGVENVADALFCESCGYDFTTGSLPRPLTPPDAPSPDAGSTDAGSTDAGVTDVDAASTATESTGAPAPDAAPPGPTADGSGPVAADGAAAFSWVAELWIDPAWYDAQDSPDPLPSPGLPAVLPLRGSSVLVGRASRSRGIHPDVDCGADSGVSRRQAQLTTDGHRWFVEDLESANGTFIGSASAALPDDPIPVGVKRELGQDDRIYLGAWTRLVIREATEDEVAALGA